MEEQTNNNVTKEPVESIIPTPTPRQSTNSWMQLTSNLPNDIPIAPNYQPRMPIGFRPTYITDPCRLTRRIYINMLNAVDTYTRLINIAPQQDRATIESLRSQMQILSIAILTIGQQLNFCTIIPLRTSSNSNLPNNYINALNITYNRVYTIFNQTLFLYEILGSNEFSTRLLIIINNLRSQLQTIDNLIAKNS